MLDQLTLRLFGKPQIMLGKTPVTGFISAKAQALLIYLAVTGNPHARKTLASLLWGNMPETYAAKNLRNALSNLKSLVGAYLVIDRDQVVVNSASPYWIDVKPFMTALSGDIWKKDLETLHQAVELYQGDFLEGLYVGDALSMEEWILGQQSLLSHMVVQALHMLVIKHLEREEYAAGIDYANRLLVIEPWREETHRHLMILLAKSRQRSAALAQYEACRKILANELGVEPLPETTTLYQRIKATVAPPPHNLPPQLKPIVGRKVELAEIERFFNDSTAQLLTLAGPGGIGKTRLAIHAAARCIEPEANVEPRFIDGVFFVSLVKAHRMGMDGYGRSLIAAMADALKFDFQGPVHPQAQLFNFLREKDMLLILDNFDHLVDEARQLVDILRLAPKIKLLVTSRVCLNLQEEHLMQIKGLDYPVQIDTLSNVAAQYSAVTLFVQQARYVQSSLRLEPSITSDVVRICELVDGVPLGIELAASWLRVLTCSEIVSEIQTSLDFLTTNLQDVPERHRSLRAVFDHSWNLLSPEEQKMFRRLSVFHGGFQREAATRVVGVSLPLLVGLVDKSLLRRNEAGRYEIHDLLRQYAEEKLEVDPSESKQIHEAQCHYFAELTAAYKEQLKGDEVAVALNVLDVERENVRAAWHWAVSHRRIDDVNLFMECL